MEEKRKSGRWFQLILRVMKGVKSRKATTEFVSGKTEHVCTRKCNTIKCSKSAASEPICINGSGKSKKHCTIDYSLSDSDHEDVQCISSSVLSDPVPSSFRHCSVDALLSSSKTEGTPLGVGAPFPSSLTHYNANNIKSDQSETYAKRKLSLNNVSESFPVPQAEQNHSGRHPSTVYNHNHTTGGATELGGNVSYWKLPWSQPKVVMCPYCNRPRLSTQDRSYKGGTTLMRSVEHPLDTYTTDMQVGKHGKFSDFNFSEFESGSDQGCAYVEDENEDVTLPEMHCHCHIGATLDASLKLRNPNYASQKAEESQVVASTPVFIAVINLPQNTKPQESSPEIIDNAGDESVCYYVNRAAGEQCHLNFSFVAPLTSSLLRNPHLAQDRPGHASREGASLASPDKRPNLNLSCVKNSPDGSVDKSATKPKAIIGWLQDQSPAKLEKRN